MSRAPVIRDPNHPDFPHGKAVGFHRGCPCDPCSLARYRQHKAAGVRRARVGIIKSARPETMTRVREHIAYLRREAAASADALDRAAGLARNTTHNLMSRPDRGLTVDNAHKVLALTPEHVRAHAAVADRGEVRRVIYSLSALGYPMAWQSKQVGHHLRHVLARGRSDTVARSIADAVNALAARVGDTPADPDRDGLTRSGIGKAKTTARQKGYYPPIYYNEDGTLDYRAIPDHPWSKNDDHAHAKITLLRLYLDRHRDLSNTQIACLAGKPDDREVNRLVERYGLYRDALDRPGRLAWLRDQLDRYDADTVDPVRFCCEIDLLDQFTFRPDHPGRVAWQDAGMPRYTIPTGTVDEAAAA